MQHVRREVKRPYSREPKTKGALLWTCPAREDVRVVIPISYGNCYCPFPPGGARLNCCQNGHSLRTVTPLYAKVMIDE